MQHPHQRNYLYFSAILFAVLWSYIFLRACFVSPLHDEVATYFHFIEPGAIWGSNASLDANNHLLNSFFGRLSYKAFGESFFAFRLPNVLSFALYFWGLYVLLKELRPGGRLLTLAGIASIPYILEYFAYARGYGMSLAFFVWIIIFARKLANCYSAGTSAALLLVSLLALLSNLSFLGITCLTITWIVLQLILHRKQLRSSAIVATVIFFAAFFAAAYPVFKLGMKMKDAGTLYYGSLDGLWDVTGKTLSKYVLFEDGNWLMLLLTAMTILLLSTALYCFRNEGLKKFSATIFGTLSWYFFGALAVILVLAEIMKVNYPEDRVGMYLVPLFLLLVAHFACAARLNFLLYLYPLFCISLLGHISLSTSVFTPDERLTDDFYRAVRNELKEGDVLVGYPTMELTWALHERPAGYKHFLLPGREFHANGDVILMKEEMLPEKHPGYEVFATEAEAGYVALKRRQQLRIAPKALVSLGEKVSDAEYADLAVFPVQDDWKGRPMKFKISGTLEKQRETAIETIVFSIFDANGKQTFYQPYDLRWYNGIAANPVVFELYGEFGPATGDNEIKVYLWNKFRVPVKASNVFVTVSELRDE